MSVKTDIANSVAAWHHARSSSKGKTLLLDYFYTHIISLTSQKLMISQIREKAIPTDRIFVKYKKFLCCFIYQLDGNGNVFTHEKALCKVGATFRGLSARLA